MILLNMVTTIEVAGIASFVVKEKFRERETTDGVKIAWVGSNFRKNFFSKTEKDIAPATLRIQNLIEESPDTPILAELGDAAETKLAQLWELLRKQGSGEKGILLVDGWMNIAYILDKTGDHGDLWVVHAYCYVGRGGWNIGARSIMSPGKWGAGLRVISR